MEEEAGGMLLLDVSKGFGRWKAEGGRRRGSERVVGRERVEVQERERRSFILVCWAACDGKVLRTSV